MSNPEKQLNNLLRDNHFQLVRQAHHKVYRNHEGKVFVTSLTPSDYRWSQNALTTLKKVLSSPPVPEVVAISEFERQQAAAVIQAQSKETGPGHQKQKSNGGNGFVYIDRKPIMTPEARRKHQEHQKLEAMQQRAQNQWESEVLKAQQAFIEMIMKKAKPLLAKSIDDYERRRRDGIERYRYYANTRLRRDTELMFRLGEVHRSKVSSLFPEIYVIAQNHTDVDNEFSDVFNRASKCTKCVRTETENYTDINLCIEHQYEKYRTIALNIDRFIPRDAPNDDIASQTKILFHHAMNSKYSWEAWDTAQSIDNRGPDDVLHRFAIRKLRSIVEELLRKRPQSIREAAA